MKKYLLYFVILVSLPAYSVPEAAIINVHDMDMIKQQKFRMEEYNDLKEMKEEKARYEKQHTSSQTLMQKIFNKKSKFVEDGGEIKIKFEE